jgi:hypothetical protein
MRRTAASSQQILNTKSVVRGCQVCHCERIDVNLPLVMNLTFRFGT